MNITIEEVEKTIKDVLGDSDILNTKSVYEKIDGESNKLKLVIFMNKIFGDHDSILYTKFIFITDIDKVKLSSNNFLYLFDINCQYNSVEFDDLEELSDKIKNIIDKYKFGPNIKIMSEFIEKPSFLINDWLKEHKISEFSVSAIKYNPKIYIIPCKSLFFSFIITVNSVDVELNITKENENFVFSFIINDETITFSKQNLNTMVETIGDTLKNNIK